MSRDAVELYRRLPVTASDEWWIDRARGSVDGRVLYLGCGAGRLALALAEVSSQLVGVDADERMLEAFAARLGPDLEPRVRLVRRQAQRVSLGERFGLVVAPSNLLNMTLDDRERAAVARVAAEHCRPDGEIALQVLNPYWMAASGDRGGGVIQPRDPGDERVEVRIDGWEFDPWWQRRRATLVYRFSDGRELTDHLDAVALFPRELRRLVAGAGLTITRRLGADPRSDRLGRDGGTWHLVCRPRAS